MSTQTTPQIEDALWAIFTKVAEAKRLSIRAMRNREISDVATFVSQTFGVDAKAETGSVEEAWKIYLDNGKNDDLAAALELKLLSASRDLLAFGPSLSKVIWVDAVRTAERVKQYASLSEKTVAFLSDPQNREHLRTRFPGGRFTDEMIEDALQTPALD